MRNIEIDAKVDLDGELQVNINDEYDYINKKDAILIIKHLTKVFEITKEELDG